MIIVLLGPPGSGKGTQAKMLSEKLKIPHISLGDILREAVREKTETGKKVSLYLDKGSLVPDEAVNELARERYSKPDCKAGFILDGYPRTVGQAQFLGPVDKAIYITIPIAEVIKRLSGRRSCEACGAVYNLNYNPPRAKDICNACRGKLYQRADDKEDVIRERFKVYEKSTAPLIDYYRKQNKVFEVDGSRPLMEVFETLVKLL